jgi:hypothetical protein
MKVMTKKVPTGKTAPKITNTKPAAKMPMAKSEMMKGKGIPMGSQKKAKLPARLGGVGV